MGSRATEIDMGMNQRKRSCHTIEGEPMAGQQQLQQVHVEFATGFGSTFVGRKNAATIWSNSISALQEGDQFALRN
jgi:hypothetical protein